MALIVQKYGGSSLRSPEHIRLAASRIKALKQTGAGVVVVVSAMGHTTDHLLKLANRTVSNPSARELDMLLTAGERVSMSLLAMALHALGVDGISFTGSQSGIMTNNDHTEAKIVDVKPLRIREELAKGKVVIIAGFQGVSGEKEITTLGRGGSDTTAVALAATLGADRCEILTDVDGLFSADPRLVPEARPISRCSYSESIEMARLGAKMHSRSLELAMKYNVRVLISHSKNPNGPRTEIVPEVEETKMEKTEIRNIAVKDGFSYFRADAKVGAVLGELKLKKITLNFFNFSEGSVSFLVEQLKASAVRKVLEDLDAKFMEVKDVATVSAVGEGVSHSPDVLPAVLEAIQETGAECLLFTSTLLSVTAAINNRHKAPVAQSLHAKLIEKK